MLLGAGHLPKVTPSFIAEFLDHLSPVRLSLLDQPTCVGCRYGKIYILSRINSDLMRRFSEVARYQISLLRNLLFVTHLSGQTYLPFCPVSLLKPSVLGMILSSSFSLRICIFCSRISTTCPSGYSPQRGTPLGPTNPPLIYIAEETLGLRRPGFSPDTRYSYRHSHF